jgi:hypothetical protein
MRKDDRVSRTRFVPIRAGQLLGLLFLAGPISDLARGSGSQARVTAIVAALIAFVLLYLVCCRLCSRSRGGGTARSVAGSCCSPRPRR